SPIVRRRVRCRSEPCFADGQEDAGRALEISGRVLDALARRYAVGQARVEVDVVGHLPTEVREDVVALLAAAHRRAEGVERPIAALNAAVGATPGVLTPKIRQTRLKRNDLVCRLLLEIKIAN